MGIATNDVKLFSYNSLRSATNHFHPSNKIGRGGFGVVYMGVLTDGSRAAIKSLSAGSRQGTNEFLTEINMISTVRHPNLVQLIGCCVEGKNRILLYEYLENNSLASALLGSKGKEVHLDWPKRAAICLGTASGLAFLHEEAEPQIVHRDIKASNILLDENFQPKIGDFGLAKLFPDNVTHVSTRVAGTVLLDIVDPDLTEYPAGEVMRFIKVALFCTQAASNFRPNMKQVVEMLSKEVNLNDKLLTEPGVYRPYNSRRLGRGSSQEESSSRANKGKQPENPFVTSTQFNSFQSATHMLPR